VTVKDHLFGWYDDASSVFVNFLVSAAVVGLIGSFIYFLVEVRNVILPGGGGLLAYVSLCFVAAVVTMTRIQAYYGRRTETIPYAAALALVMFAFAIKFSAAAGSVVGWGGGFLALMVNIFLFAFLWVVTDYMGRACALSIHDEARHAKQREAQARSRYAPRPMPWEFYAPPEAASDASSPAAQAAPPAAKPAPPDEDVDDEDVYASLSKRIAHLKAGKKLPPAKHPALSVFLFSIPVLICFALGGRLLPDEPAIQSRVFFSMVVYVTSAFLLLALTTFLRIKKYLERKKIAVGRSVALNWILIGAFSILLIVFVADLFPRPERASYAVSPQHTGQGPKRGVTSRLGPPVEGVTIPEKGGAPTSARDENPEAGPKGAPGAEGEQQAQNDEGSSKQGGGGSKQGSEGKQGEGKAGEESAGKEGEQGEEQGKGKGDSKGSGSKEGQGQRSGGGGGNRSRSQGRAQQQPQPRPQSKPAPHLSDVPGGKLLSLVLLAVVVAVIVIAAVRFYKQFRKRHGEKGAFKAFLKEYLDRLRQWLAHLNERARALLAGLRRPAPASEVAPQLRHFKNPFDARGDLVSMNAEEAAKYTYDAMLYLASLNGYTRAIEQTPHEFLKRLPRALRSLKGDLASATSLYVRAAYSDKRFSATHTRELRRIWQCLETTLA